MIMLPLTDDRRAIHNILTNIDRLLSIYGCQNDPVARPLFGTFWDSTSKSWIYKFQNEIIEELRTRSFFKRFTAKDLAPFLAHMTVKQHSTQSIIFPDNSVCILLAGLVEVVHHKQGASKVELVGHYRTGDMLGFSKGDGGITQEVETWCKCISNVEAIWINRDQFTKLWANQHKYERRIFYESIKLQPIFSQFSELTLHLLAYELVEVRSFKSGEVIVRQHKRSALNPVHWTFFKK